MIADVTLHVPEAIRARAWAMRQFYGTLAKALQGEGLAVEVVTLDPERTLARIEADHGFHIVHHARIRHPRVLNAGKAYIEPFFTLDPWGYRLFSSIAAETFRPGPDPDRDAAVFDDIRARMVGARKSHYEQPAEVIPAPDHCIAVFLQTEDNRDVGETCHLGPRHMIKALLERDDPRPVVVKPHPKEKNLETLDWLTRQARKEPRLQIFLGNIHDLLAKADVVVTINSAVGIEAMLHERPVVLCGDTDFHHICEVVTRRRDLDAALARAEARAAAGDWPFRAYIGWYYGRMCHDPRAPDFGRRVLDKLRAMEAAQAGFR
ncbi:capsular polysaccharide export protein, LipB/KpsS family [Tabrizicola oligotrophica]|uniref:Capsular biosynthesis protein n=1 Tax=Tabrizicola oligotrophica TaxID=2710650 RepID=A0A6M0QPS3_9RHOB|nr:hypothetical protein [Tabrizicola oligotrophica]NEY89427.1 hypothetical protein [Tabrizicola oligotrophica]